MLSNKTMHFQNLIVTVNCCLFNTFLYFCHCQLLCWLLPGHLSPLWFWWSIRFLLILYIRPDVMRNTSYYLRSGPQKRRFTWGNALSMERKFFVLRSKAAQCAIRRACNVRQLWQSEFAWQPQSSKYKAQLSATTYIDSSTETPSIGGFHS